MGFYPPFITNKMEHFSLKSGYVMHTAKCVGSYSQRKLVLSVYITAKIVLPALFY